MKTYIQITSGRGPVECSRVVVLVMKELIKDAERVGISIDVVEFEKAIQDDCMFSATLSVDSADSPKLRDKWNGPVLWVATKNPFRPHHKRKNWFVGVKFFELNDFNMNIDDNEIEYQTMRAGGNGGQNVNRVESAVRAIYKPTGLSVVCTDERSQTQNKRVAKERLLLKLAKESNLQKAEQDRQVWMNHNMLERGNPIRTFRGEL